MNQPKIIFFDIDGTLIDMEKKQISEKMLETLRKLKENHIMICIATGRPPLTLPHFEGVDFDVFMTFNGSYCYNQREVIFSCPIPAEDVHTIIRNATEMNRPVSIASRNRLAANGRDADLVEYFSFAKIEVEIADDFDKVAEEEIYQIMLGCSIPEREPLLQNVKHAQIAAWWDHAVDVIPSRGGKGVGVEKVLEYYHLDKSEAMAFGDGSNDIEMLMAVGTGVAMANASDKVKEAADEVCGDVAEDGIYHYCVEHHLI